MLAFNTLDRRDLLTKNSGSFFLWKVNAHFLDNACAELSEVSQDSLLFDVWDGEGAFGNYTQGIRLFFDRVNVGEGTLKYDF